MQLVHGRNRILGKMPYSVQTNAILPYVLFAIGYLGILIFGGSRRDKWAFVLVALFCILLGLRDTKKMSEWADPVWTAAILTNQVSAGQILPLGGVDYLPFYLLHGITSRILNFEGAFFLLNMLYLPAIYLLYRLCGFLEGMFFLVAGWLLFVNSGILLLANFFRQGQGALYLLVLILAFAIPAGSRWARWGGAVVLPAIHLSSVPFAGGLLVSRTRRFYMLFGAVFALFCIVAYVLLQHLGVYALYMHDPNEDSFKNDLIIKVLGVYALLLCGVWMARRALPTCRNEIKAVQRVMIGFLLPAASLLIFANAAPEIGTRFIYYFHAVAFAYLACCVANSKATWMFSACALGFCLFGAITWTYPTVAVLLVW